MIDLQLTGNRGTAGWRPIPSPEATLVARTYLRVRTSHDRALMLGLCRPRRHHNYRSTIYGAQRSFSRNAACVTGITSARKSSAAAAYWRISYWAASWLRSPQKCIRLRGLQLQ
jgi:hypothetical protein